MTDSTDGNSFRLQREGNRIIAEWAGMGTLRAHREGTEAEFIPAEGADTARTQKFYRGIAAAFVRHLQGGLTLHASAFAKDGCAVACIGPPGSGKSTLAATMCAQNGARFFSDDAAALEFRNNSVWVLPSEESLWLTADSAHALALDHSENDSKQPIAPARRATSADRLVAILKLSFDDNLREPMLLPITGHRVFQVVSESMFRFIVDEPEVVARDFGYVSHLAATVPVYELARPRRFAELGAACDLLAGFWSTK